jgi:biotin carboxylase
MAQALMRAGIPHLRQFCSADPDAIAAWLDESGLAGQRLVVKPPKSVGTDEVHVVPAGQDWRPAFDRIIGKENKAGVRNDAVLVEEFCEGTEYIVDTYSVDGRHGLVDVCRYTKRQRDDRIGIYDRVYFLPPHHPDVPVLRDYAMRVVEAVGIRNGCGHNEIMLTEDGPRLIEVAARLAGGGHQGVTMLATGDNHVQRTIRHHLDGAFRPDFDWQQYVCAAFLSAPRPGVFRNGDVFDAAREFPTYNSEKFFFGTGDVVPATDDIFTPLGWVILADPDEDAVERDYARLKELERQVVIDPA